MAARPKPIRLPSADRVRPARDQEAKAESCSVLLSTAMLLDNLAALVQQIDHVVVLSAGHVEAA